MRLTPFVLGFSLVLVSSIASAAVTNYKVHLTQAPSWQNDAGADVGDGTFTYDDGNQTLSGVVNHTVENAFNAKLYYREGDAGFGGNGDKTIKSFKDTDSPIGVAVKLTAEQATALANSQVHFQVGAGFNEADGVLVPEGGGTPTDDAGTGTTDPDAGGTDPGTTDPGTTDPGTTDPGTTDPGTTDPGDNTNSDDSNADGSEEEEESSGKKSGCSVLRAGANDPATIGGASLAGLFGIALLARRRRKS